MGKLEIKNEKFHSDGILENTTRFKNLVEVNESNNNNNNNNSNNSNNDDNEDNNNNNSSNNNSQKLPNTGSPSGNLSGIIAVGLSTIGAILFRKKKTKF